jgi:hypothetical protein
MKSLFGIGESHLGAIIRATKQGGVQERHKISISTLLLSDYKPVWELEGGSMKANAKFAEALIGGLDNSSPSAIFCSIGGGDHVALGLVANARPFDFIIPDSFVERVALGAPVPQNTGGADEIIPFDLAVATIRWRIGGIELYLKWLKSISALPVYLLCLPPTIGDECYIRRNPGGFAEQIEEQGISPVSIRYKLWWLQASVQKELSQNGGAVFLPVPPAAANSDGYLSPEFYGGDPVHANAEYGALVIKQLAEVSSM